MGILIYDGECNVCSKFIMFIVKINKNPNLNITDFNSNWTKKNIELDVNIDSMIFIANNKKYIYSDSVIELLCSANKMFMPLKIIKLVPKSCRDRIYKIIAKNRKNIMTNSTCPLPTEKFKSMLLK
ncbi:hypothetical protein bcgnr5378_31450 [Bacillus cereus]|uniref:thiol-disulfide oxidoreductase DCC family protein n=1 Tax=Bacillus cereus group TaxID=86661 RepID=UPI00077833AC|nr:MULTISPECIES: DUF393 domain-containing protein [Bacillus cereus group]KXY98054.1 hypothetical protein AT280_28030 [Bacillus cereus]HDR4617045.1 DUF393 domain-containing protein [Bacillus cereus]HDR4623032.1 DUF393 domain-containing protein [Bacillus cereus]